MPQLSPLPRVSDQPLTVILLAHNAAANLQDVVNGWLNYLDRRPGNHQVILVDDGSSDATKDKAAKLNRIEILVHPQTLGEGAALRTAFAVARNPLVFYTLCDPRYSPKHLNRLLVDEWPSPYGDKPQPLIDLVHLAVCCHSGTPAPLAARVGAKFLHLCQRILFGDHSASPACWQGWANIPIRLINRILFGVRNLDPQCPYRLMRREVFEHLVIQSEGPFAHTEILAKANFRTLLISEDIPLGDNKHPLQAPPRTGTTWGQDFGKVFWRPDFGAFRKSI